MIIPLMVSTKIESKPKTLSWDFYRKLYWLFSDEQVIQRLYKLLFKINLLLIKIKQQDLLPDGENIFDSTAYSREYIRFAEYSQAHLS